MEKIGGLAGALAIILAIVAGLVNIPGVNVALFILILGIISGVTADQEHAVRVYLAVLAIPVIGAALGGIPAIGDHLNAIFGNLATAAAGMAASMLVRRLFEMVKGSLTGLAGGDS